MVVLICLTLLMNIQQSDPPYLVVLGIGQDAGVPQAGTDDPRWEIDSLQHFATSLALVDPETKQRWLFEATPDFPEQLRLFDIQVPPEKRAPGLDGIFLTHAHIGHYTGLMYLGRESIGAKGVPVFAMEKMDSFLENNGPWSQLVQLENIIINRVEPEREIQLNERLSVLPFLVPHRQEYSEVAGYIINGPEKSVLFIPDIDSWEEWDEWGVRIENMIAKVDVAYLDATFFANGEIPGRDMSNFPHPFIRHSMKRFKNLPEAEKSKIRFIHLNHTNKALLQDSDERMEVIKKGFAIANPLEKFEL